MVRHKLNDLLQNRSIYTVVLVIRKSALDISAQEIHCNENPIYVYPEKELHGLSVPISTFIQLYIPRIGPHIFLSQNRQVDLGYIYIAHRHKNVEIGNEAPDFFSGIICFEFSVLCLFIPLPRNCYYIGKLDHSKQTFICTKPERAFIQLPHYRSTAPDNEKKEHRYFYS